MLTSSFWGEHLSAQGLAEIDDLSDCRTVVPVSRPSKVEEIVRRYHHVMHPERSNCRRQATPAYEYNKKSIVNLFSILRSVDGCYEFYSAKCIHSEWVSMYLSFSLVQYILLSPDTGFRTFVTQDSSFSTSQSYMLIPYSTPLLDTTLLEIRTRIPTNTKRVQRYVKVKCVIRPWSHKVEHRTMSTANSGYALGSDEGNVRIWKVKASEKLGVATVREWARIEYCNKLKERWAVDAEVARISRFNWPMP